MDSLLVSGNPTRATKWKCAKCGHENKSIRADCGKCGHEPTTGRRDVHPEGRKYTPSGEGDS